MAIVLQILGVIFIVLAVAYFLMYRAPVLLQATRFQLFLALYQIVLCGWFFALCVSDVLDIWANFSLERFVLDGFYALAFATLAAYAFLFADSPEDGPFRVVIWACALLIAMQCFVYPYATKGELARVVQALEGALVFGLLVSIAHNLRRASFVRLALLVIVALEIAVAVGNSLAPPSFVIDDFQLVDIPLNFAALYMRPVLFASVALAYRAWCDRRRIS